MNRCELASQCDPEECALAVRSAQAGGSIQVAISGLHQPCGWPRVLAIDAVGFRAEAVKGRQGTVWRDPEDRT